MNKKIVAMIFTLVLAVPTAAASVQAAEATQAEHTHIYDWEDDEDYIDIDNGEYHQVRLNCRRGKCGCGAISIDTSSAGKIWLETHTFNGIENGYPKCTDCGYVEYAPWLPMSVEDEK